MYGFFWIGPLELTTRPEEICPQAVYLDFYPLIVYVSLKRGAAVHPATFFQDDP